MRIGLWSVATICWTAILAAVVVDADIIEFTDGSMIYGTITTIHNGKCKFETGFAGIIEIDQNKIKAAAVESDAYVALKSGSTIKGKLIKKYDKSEVHTSNGIIDISQDAVLALWQEGQENPLLPPAPKKRKWKSELGFDIAGKTGNSEKFSGGGSGNAVLASDNDSLKLYVRSSRSRENGTDTADEIVGGIDYESFFKKKSSWYARIELESDDIEALDLRTTAGLGYGYFFVNNDTHVLRGRAGIQFRHESFDTGSSNSAPGFDFGVHHMRKFTKFGKLTNDLTYAPSFEDFGDFRIYHESGFEIPLAASDFWKLRMGITNEYNSMVAKGRNRLDTTYFSRVVLNWE